MRIPAPVFLVCAMIGPALAQPIPITGQAVPDLAAYDDVMTSLMQQYQVPGAALAVVRDGRLVFARGYGYADRDLETPVQPDSLFRLASITKPHTAAAILNLIEQGKLNLSDKAFSILANLTPIPGTKVDPRIATITIQNLLEHKSGWYGEADGTGYDPMFDVDLIAYVVKTPPPADCPAIIRYQLSRRLDRDPGTYYSYLNFGYCVLGEVIHQVSGVPYDHPKPFYNDCNGQLLNNSNVYATIGGQQVPVLYAGSQETLTGLDRLTVSIPQSLAGLGMAGLVAQVDGRVTNTVTIQIK